MGLWRFASFTVCTIPFSEKKSCHGPQMWKQSLFHSASPVYMQGQWPGCQSTTELQTMLRENLWFWNLFTGHKHGRGLQRHSFHENCTHHADIQTTTYSTTCTLNHLKHKKMADLVLLCHSLCTEDYHTHCLCSTTQAGRSQKCENRRLYWATFKMRAA